jgi:hypothetical protein
MCVMLFVLFKDQVEATDTHQDSLRMGIQVKYPHSLCSSFTDLATAFAVVVVCVIPPVIPAEKMSLSLTLN